MVIYGYADDLLNFKFDSIQFSQKGIHTISPHTIEHIKKVCKELDKNIADTVSSSLGEYDPEEYYNRFMDHADESIEDLIEYFPTKRDKKRLSRVISYKPRNKNPIILSKFIFKAIELLEKSWSVFMISSILEGVLHYWNQIYNQKLNQICDILVFKIQNYDGNFQIFIKLNDPIYYHKNLSSTNHCFGSTKGPLYLAEELVLKNHGIDYLYNLEPFKTSMNGYEFISNYIWGYTKAAIHHKKFDAQQNDIMNRLELFKCKDTIKKTLPLIVIHANKFIEQKDMIFSKSIQLIGDPVDDAKWAPPNNHNFEDFNDEINANLKKAREILSIWLTGQFIEIFFDKLARIANNFDPQRKFFWQMYLSHISYFKIYGSAYHQSKLKQDDRITKLVPNRFGYLDGQQECAFCFKIKNKLFVEFISTGNALYVYDSINPICPDMDYQKLHVNDLKHENFRSTSLYLLDHGKSEGKLTHRGNWEVKLHRWFRDQMGITVSGGSTIHTEELYKRNRYYQ